MARTPFVSAKLKVQRAYRHIHEFKTLLDGIAKSDFARAIVEPNEDLTAYTLRIEADSLPPDFSLVIGDAVHCMRSSLDHLATQIMWEATGANKRIHFPMHEERDNLVDMARKSPVNDTFPEFENLILDTVNPCKEGNAPLWLAGKLSNIDKHNEIVVVAGATRVWLERFSDENDNVFVSTTIGVTNGSFTSPVRTSAPMKIDGKVKPALDILFGPVIDLDKQPVFPILMSMVNSTTDAINAIEAEYLK